MIRLHRVFCIALASLIVLATSTTFAGFSLNEDAFLSVDLNGDNLPDVNATQLGWDPNSATTIKVGAGPGNPPDVLWSPFGGNGPGGGNNQGGDDVQLPNNNAGVTATSITSTYSINALGLTDVDVTISLIDPNNTGGGTINSRDRGEIGAGDQGGTFTENHFGRNMYRDLIFAGGTGSNSIGGNGFTIEISGLVPGTPYTANFYAYDRFGSKNVHFTGTAPADQGGSIGWWDPDPNAAGSFLAAADVQEVIWTGGASIVNLPAPAVLKQIADGSGKVTFWAYGRGGDGTPEQNNYADTTYLNGLQIAIPEPGTVVLSMLGLCAMALGRRRKD